MAEGGFCVKVPKEWEVMPVEKDGTRSAFQWFRKGQGGVFIVSVNSDPSQKIPDDMTKTIGTPKDQNPTVTQGELAGGKGKWVLSIWKKQGGTNTLVQGAKGIISCGATGDDKSASEMLELCKTLLPL